MKPRTSVVAVACCFVAGPASGWQQSANSAGRRVYVEAFATKGEAARFRSDVTAELRKLNYVSLVPDESNADLILGGGGEIWVRGYRSFSPRSPEKLPSNGVPVYGGYLSVELRNKNGVTLWSDLVTPHEESEDVSKNLAKRIAKNLAQAIGHLESPTEVRGSQPAIALHGAGATFPYPVYAKWFANYRTEHPGVEIDYEATGSDAGIRKLLAGELDFGASDSPNAIGEIAPREGAKYLYFPSVVGAVVPIVNLPGVTENIAFTPEALAAIFLGKVKKWNDPILTKANRGIRLPDLDIVVVHRSDGSGTSYAWTDYLSQTNAEWKTMVGASLTPKWPVGRGASGNDGVAKLVKELGGSIGYVEYIYALQNHLSYGKIRNQNGDFVEASLESIEAAVSHAMEISDELKVSLVDAPGPGSYPIASFTWLVIPNRIVDDAKRNAVVAFLRWMVGPGQRQAAALGYLALPKDVVIREEDAIGGIH
ncbi:MAG TPA: phosphate ABC transporter substrate-binding protein PstS [Bryobacteraceae bacterium]